jgi:hypothetical protein
MKATDHQNINNYEVESKQIPDSSRATAFGRRDQPALESGGFARRCRRPAINCVGGGAWAEKTPKLHVQDFRNTL